MLNALRVATSIVEAIPAEESPECTCGYEGFYHLMGINGGVDHAEVSYITRDHNRDIFEKRMAFMKEVLAAMDEKYGKGVVGVNEVPEELIRLYCTLDVSPIEGEDRAMTCRRIIEKPKPEEILSLYAILGRVVLPPEAFELMEKGIAATPEGKEFYLTDVFTELGMNDKLLAYNFDGKRYDMGNKLGIMQANCEIALNHDEIGEDFKAYLKELVKTF
jgi:UTP-glucose-1-phosphate uridylyltransferase